MLKKKFLICVVIATMANAFAATNVVVILSTGNVLTGGDALIARDVQSGDTLWEHRDISPELTALAPLPNGRFLAATKRGIQVRSANGALEDEWAPLAEKAWVTSMAVGSNIVFVCDAGQRAIWRYDLSGKLLSRIPSLDDSPTNRTTRFIIPSPYFPVVFHGGFFYVANTGEHEIRVYTPEGEIVRRWGFPATQDPTGFVGCCNPIHLAIHPDGSLITAEKGIPRIKAYTLKGDFKGVLFPAGIFPKNALIDALAINDDGTCWVVTRGELVRMKNEK